VFGGTYPGLLAAMAVGGIGSTVAAPVGGMVIARVVRAGRRPLAFALERSSIPAATLIAGMSVPTLAAVVHWRVVFGIGAVLVALVLLMPIPAMSGQDRPATQAPLRPFTPLLLVTVMFFLGSAAATALSTFFVGHGVALGMAAGTAGVALAATSAATIGVRIVLGLLGVRVPGRATSAVLLLAGAAGFALLVVPSVPAALAGALLAGGAGWGWTGVLGLAVVQSHPDAPGASTALVQAGGCVGGIAGPLLMGALTERYGYSAGWLAMAAFAAVAGLVAAVNGGIWRWVSHKARSSEVDLQPAAT
jgi:predicted MFS family arabinose efflux permease